MNRKVIIVEGCDRTGKDTLISKLKEYFINTVELHCGIPDCNSSLYDYYYDGLIYNTLDAFYSKECNAIIHNRSMYGEYVYGPKYRNEDRDSVLHIINNLELGRLKTFIGERELYFILLTSSNVDLLIKNNDGNSISNKAEDIEYELESFNEIFSKSKIKNKLKVFVNNNDSFRSKDDIYNEVLSFITKGDSLV